MKHKTSLPGVILLLMLAPNLFGSITGDSLVTLAWKALADNDQQQAENFFNNAIKMDDNNTRAYLGLSYLFNLQKKDDQAWQAYEKVIRIEKNHYPYIYAAWTTTKVRDDNFVIKSTFVDIAAGLLRKPDAAGILQVMANEALGEYYQQQGDLKKAMPYYRNMDAVLDWMLIGPFDNTSASGFDRVYPPELAYEPLTTYEGKNAIPVQWFKPAGIRHDNWIDHRRYFSAFQSILYANTFVHTPQQQPVQLRVGTSGSLKTLLNDELVLECFDENNNDMDTYIVATELQPGWNRLLIKCGFSEIDQCNFLVRITDAAGAAIQTLEFSTAPQTYPSKPGAPVTIVPNFAIEFFKEKINNNPDHLENHLLLADSYLRNDMAIEAELVLRSAIAQAPNCALLWYHMTEAYLRGEKYDEYNTVFEKIYALDNTIPEAVEFKIDNYFETEEFDQAAELISHYEKLLPESEEVYRFYLGLYGHKEQTEKILETSQTAFRKYPESWLFASTEAILSISTTRKYDRAIAILKNFLKIQYDETVLLRLANVYLAAAQVKKWEDTFTRAIELDPAATGYYYQMAKTYQDLQDYARAESAIKKAIDLAPNGSVYWSLLGGIYRAQNKIAPAQQAFLEALKFDPTDYDARQVLREIEGKTSIFSHFNDANIDSLIKNAPAQSDYPDDGAVVLLKDSKRVVYERGASESADELLIKVFNNRGIDDFKEYSLGYNPYAEVLVVEKAVVIKPDGAEIKADIDDNYLVFKSLTQNDVIYIKWKIKNYYFGKLAHHFWDTIHFNTFYPIKFNRYSLLVPGDFKFRYQPQNMTLVPGISETKDGTLYRWSLHNEPAIKYEYGMPGLEDVGKILQISSIDSWDYLVDWYMDLSGTKTRSSYEIKEQVEKLFAGQEQLSDIEKIKIIYEFITENIRYSSVYFRQSGLIPQKARDVLVTRIGDCKDMTTLCLAMLKEIGIAGYYLLLNQKSEGLNQNIVPGIAFNHCIAAVATDVGLKYLDLTGYNYPFGSAPDADLEGFALLIKPGSKEPFYLPKQEFLPRLLTRQSKVELRADNSMLIQLDSKKTASMAASMRYYYRNKSQQEREKTLLEFLTKEYPTVKLLHFNLENLDNLAPAVQYQCNYEVSDYLTEAGQFKFFKIPWDNKLQPENALSYDTRTYPYYYWPDIDTVYQEIEIKLPPGYDLAASLKDVKLSSAIADYSLQFSVTKGVIKGKRRMVNKQSIVNPAGYSEFKEFWNNAVKEDDRQVLLQAK